MAASNDAILIRCKYKDYELIHRSVVAAARRARQADDSELLLALRNVLSVLGSSEGLRSDHLSNFNLWDVD